MRSVPTLWGGAAAALALLLALALAPVQVQITIAPRAGVAEAGLPTTTPAPPTATAAPTQPPTAAPTQPPAPTRERPRPSATPEPSPQPSPEPAGVPQVVIEKRASADHVLVGETVSFTLLAANRGGATARDVVVSDELPAPLEVVDMRSSKGEIALSGRLVTAYPGELAPGEEQRYTIVARVPEGAAPGPIANTAIITTGGGGDDPGDNSSTVTIELRPPLTAQRIPPALPRTADPLDPAAQPLMAIYWPLLVLALGLIGFGAAARYGAFRQRIVRVTVGAPPPGASAREQAELRGLAVTLQIDPHEIAARWRRGEGTGALAELVAARNPGAGRLAASVAVQRILREQLRG